MKFFGVHEVRMIRPDGVSAGYFDNFESALAAVENEPSQYRAAYVSLNPIRPDLVSARLNPQTLVASRNTASDTDVLRRVRLLFDLDPHVRPGLTAPTPRNRPLGSKPTLYEPTWTARGGPRQP